MSSGRGALRRLLALPLAAALAAAVPGGTGRAAFADLGQHWATLAVERMAAKGIVYGVERDGKTVFEPDRPVTRWEAVVMLIRALGLEEAARRRTAIPAAFREAASVPTWAFGAVAEAVERGILAGPELSAFRGGERATRLQVATWLARALQLEDGSGSPGAPPGGEGVPGPPFADLGGLTAAQVRVVALVAETGLMTGGDGRFRPADPVTRAEMAVLLDRVDRLLENALDAREATGKVESTVGGLVLRVGAGQRVFALPEDTLVYYEGLRASRAFLAEGDTVNVVADAQGRARVVEVIAKPLAAEGTVVEVTPGGAAGGARIRLRLGDGSEQTYAVRPDSLVALDGRPVALRRLAPGQLAVLEGRDGAVTRVTAWSRVEEVRGELVALARTEGGHLLQVRVRGTGGDPEERVFTLPEGAGLTRDGRPAQPGDLKAQDRVILTLRGGRVFAVEAESYERELTGTLRAVRFGQRVEVTVEVARPGGGSRVETYPVRGDATIRKDGRTAGVTSLRPGDRLEFTVTGDDITRLAAETRYTEVEGTLVRIAIADPPEITVRLPDGEEKRYHVSPDVTVRLGNQQVSLVSLRPGQRVSLSVAYDQVVAVRASVQSALDDLRGVVRYLDFQENSLVLELEDGRTRHVKAGGGFLVVRFGNVHDRLSGLEVGDAVIVIGRDVPGLPFEAQVVVVVGAGG